MIPSELEIGKLYRHVRKHENSAWISVEEAVEADINEYWFYCEAGVCVGCIQPDEVFCLLDKTFLSNEPGPQEDWWLRVLFNEKVGWICIPLEEFEESIMEVT